MADATVAVIIPAYNAARFLGSALDSLRAQTFGRFDALVVDDGSSDETSAVAAGYPEVRLIKQGNAGVAAARNRGVRESVSEWLAFLDADDLWMPEKLELQLQCAVDAGASAVFCDVQTIDVNGRAILGAPAAPVSLELGPLLLHDGSIPQATSSTILVRRAIFESIAGYDESLATMADWDLLLRLQQVARFAHVPRELAAYRRYPGTMSRSVTMLERESLLILDKVFSRPDLPEELRRLETRSRAWNDLVLSGSYFGVGRVGAAARFGLRALRHQPSLITRILAMPIRRVRRIGTAAQ